MKRRRILLISLFIIMVLAAIGSWFIYSKIFGPNVDLHGEKDIVIYIPTGSDFEQVMDSLHKHQVLSDEQSFIMLAKRKGYNEKVKAGRYRIQDGMSNNSLVNMLKSGRQEPVNLTFNNIRVKKDLAKKIAGQIETTEEEVLAAINDTARAAQYGLDTTTIMVIFLPNTYEIFWNTSAVGFVERMYEEYTTFWNKDRLSKADAMGLSPVQVSILASIVQSETNVASEMSRIAGLYINRLNKNMNLEACPTVIFAVGDFSLKRVLKKHTQCDSPYNTYIHPGLPPGPICVPNPSVIDAVLNYEKNDYLFMCAKEDFSGSHNFARTNREHEKNARRYQIALDAEIRKGKQNKN